MRSTTHGFVVTGRIISHRNREIPCWLEFKLSASRSCAYGLDTNGDVAYYAACRKKLPIISKQKAWQNFQFQATKDKAASKGGIFLGSVPASCPRNYRNHEPRHPRGPRLGRHSEARILGGSDPNGGSCTVFQSIRILYLRFLRSKAEIDLGGVPLGISGSCLGPSIGRLGPLELQS